LTLSAADLHWVDLFRLLDENYENLTEQDRRRLLQENPMVVDKFFSLRVEAFIKYVSYIVIIDGKCTIHFLPVLTDAEFSFLFFRFCKRGTKWSIIGIVLNTSTGKITIYFKISILFA